MTSTLVRAAFALVVLATIGAFFVTQRLKSEFPLVLRFAASPSAISPNGDGVRDGTLVGFDLSEDATVTFSVLDPEGNEIRRMVDERPMKGDVKHRFYWDGRDSDGRIVPDGVYGMRVVRRDQGRVINSFKEIRVDTRRPRVRLVSARPGVISPAGAGRRTSVRIRYRGPRNEAPEFRIFRTDGGPTRVVARFRGDDTRSAVWHGTLRGRTARDGNYTFTVTVRDRAGNVAVAPAEVPTAAVARRGTGVAVRHLTVRGPLEVLTAGSLARLEVGPHHRRFRFALSRLGSRRALRRGSRRGGRLRVRIPRRARTGVYLVRVRAAGRRALWPLAVAGLPRSGRGAGRPRPLVVLPAVTWQGENRFDDDLDGFADALATGPSVRRERPFEGGALPRRLRAEAAPLLRFLDRARLGYDLTTDVSLARARGPALGNAPGVAFAGSARWLTPALEQKLRRYVERGGRLASFGADAFRRRVRLDRRAIVRVGAPRAESAFGERTRLLRTSAAPLVVEEDRLGLFRGLDRFVGDFSIFERTTEPPPDARLLASAGRDPGQGAFVAYRIGSGLLIRSGTPQWSSELSERRLGVEVPRVTRRIWRLLAGT